MYLNPLGHEVEHEVVRCTLCSTTTLCPDSYLWVGPGDTVCEEYEVYIYIYIYLPGPPSNPDLLHEVGLTPGRPEILAGILLCEARSPLYFVKVSVPCTSCSSYLTCMRLYYVGVLLNCKCMFIHMYVSVVYLYSVNVYTVENVPAILLPARVSAAVKEGG